MEQRGLSSASLQFWTLKPILPSYSDGDFECQCRPSIPYSTGLFVSEVGDDIPLWGQEIVPLSTEVNCVMHYISIHMREPDDFKPLLYVLKTSFKAILAVVTA